MAQKTIIRVVVDETGKQGAAVDGTLEQLEEAIIDLIVNVSKHSHYPLEMMLARLTREALIKAKKVVE